MAEGNGRAAALFKKLIAGQEIPYRWIENLEYDHRVLIFSIIGEGRDPQAREARLKAELLGLGKLDFWNQIESADPGADLDQLAAGGWVFMSMADMLKPLPPLQWVVKGLIPRSSVSLFFGAPKNLKSLILLDMAVCVAGNKTWLSNEKGEGGFAVQTCPVIWLDLENGARRMQERAGAFARARGIGAAAPFFAASMPRPWPDLGEAGSVAGMMRDFEALGPGLLIIDHLGQSHKADENTGQMAVVMSSIRTMAEALNFGVGVLHHQIKHIARYGISGSEALRGHSSILAGADLAIQVERMATDRNGVNLKIVASRGYEIPDFGAKFAFEHKSDGSNELETARFFGAQVSSIDDQIEAEILAIVEMSPGLNQSALRSLVSESVENAGDVNIREVIAKVEAEHKVRVETTGKRGAAKYYHPAEVDG